MEDGREEYTDWQEFANQCTENLELLEPTDLYNLLQQSTVYSNLSDPNFLLLIDARDKNEYNESHVVTAKKAQKDKTGHFMVPYDGELECKQNVVVYDSKSSTLREEDFPPALLCGMRMWDNGSRNKVKILKGGYEEFSKLYPFLRTQKIMFMPKEMDEIKPYPIEVIPGLLYFGNWKQGNAEYIQKDLKIKGHVNCCVEAETFFSEPGPHLLHCQVSDDNDADLYSKFQTACQFIDTHIEKNEAVLVFDNLGISRCVTVVVAFLMRHFKKSLEDAYNMVLSCSSTIRPYRGFIEQLSKWEQDVLGKKTTNIDDPNY
ncbi:serine/threonine/tyrosine-interacting-like protein 1 [Mytilus edulis]|uniref:Serine/threonine/tyrosine-interacting-like protein 1 n=2 Tax=Mytilus galloprovincialis TaxID=29158 RepID=A0A8B6C3Y7_MYTGA|nr:serine/threonine/tyrosine-interacting-like protein 1 [Mytilus galloprovincialis]